MAFDFVIQYRENILADALSRQFIDDSSLSEGVKTTNLMVISVLDPS